MSKASITTQEAIITIGAAKMKLYVATPDNAHQAPALIVLQEAFGVNSHIRSVCERFAREGFVAVAPELFHRSGSGLEFKYDEFAKIKPIFSAITNEQLAEDLAATFRWLHDAPNVDPHRISVIGYCMGGFAATLAACTLPVKTAISYYGGGIVEARPGLAMRPLLPEFHKLKAPALFIFGDQDHGIPESQIEAIRAELIKQKKAHEIVVYPGAEHGFFCDERASYNAEAAAKAWDRTLAWLNEGNRKTQ